MLSLLMKAATFMLRKVDEDLEQDKYEAAEYKNVFGGTVTRFCDRYGLVDDSIYFTSNEVLGGVPLQVGQKVNILAQKSEPSGGWKAIKVELVTNQWDEDGICTLYSDPSDQMETHKLIGMITLCTNDDGYINETTYFTMDNVCEGFQPFVGDWIQAQYFIEQTTWKSQASSVKPLRYKRIDKVRITRILHRSGVVDDAIFFTLESLQLPFNYVPRKDDVVNLVAVESSQSLHQWRAICIAPAEKESVPLLAINNKNLEQIDVELFSDKGGLEITRSFDFGTMKNGERKDLMVWIENKGKETQTLLRYSVAGWERENQFLLASVQMVPATFSKDKQQQGLCCNTAGVPIVSKHCLSSSQNNGSGRFSFPLCNYQSYTGTNTCERTSGQDLATDSLSTLAKLLKDMPQTSESMSNQINCPPANHPTEKINLHFNTDAEIVEGAQQISPGGKAFINLTCEAKNPGRCRDLLLFYFKNFVIGRYVVVDVITDEETLLAPRSQYYPVLHRPHQTNQKETNTTIIAVQYPKRLMRRHIPSFLPQYPIPERLKECIGKGADVLTIEPDLAQPLSMSSYVNRFSTLLWLEEINAEMEIREFNMMAVVLKKFGDFLTLEVPGLVEGRPSVVIGDRVIVKSSYGMETEVQYFGYVIQVNDDELVLKFNSAFVQTYDREPVDVEFTYNRVSARRCHFGVEQAVYLGETVLLPAKIVPKSPQTVTTWNDIDMVMLERKNCCKSQDQMKNKDANAELSNSCAGKGDSPQDTGDTVGENLGAEPSGQKECNFYNSLLNEHQKFAVRQILRGESRPTPYIVFGPPGTGKTVTILEAILQIHFTLPDSRILAAAPSNSAADLLCLRLHESGLLKQGDMVRVNATSRLEEYIPEIVQPYSKDGEDLRDAARFRIIISTCSTAGLFYQIGLRTGHFTHVFVDEAGQASEPECLIPLLLVSEKDGQIVLAGDPMQLGPIIKSKIAKTYGLSISLLERLMTQPLYSRNETLHALGSYNPLLVTKLVNNYRSHSCLLDLPAKLFYHNELKMCMDQSVANTFCNWEKLPKKGFPIIFHGLRGNEMREGSNPSWFNPKEAVQVMRYCCLLVKLCTSPVQPSDIGIITPYQKQVQKIRVLLRSVNLADLKVGSVEEFQGQEKMVIIVSTVRSSEENLSEDKRHILGFLSNPKRFNVAITRAKALLIVVGNPHILLKDQCWGTFLEYCVLNNVYVGCNLPNELLTQ
ncbi:LOW QUALITY PROTEIN: RNA helicase Mov10l1-like [Leucoraja erinacea]|uniref:LOW QUALITY PROTEIN: RNA helicase Mov10l1-like n=1 Tax=Leucoraja erinaceus TaxID=7782 RepID=UPI0024557850|nr:LOW QUALITY PROTEIN: RNA helicase Mov10l1-like [Leucoraja erinacea]